MSSVSAITTEFDEPNSLVSLLVEVGEDPFADGHRSLPLDLPLEALPMGIRAGLSG